MKFGPLVYIPSIHIYTCTQQATVYRRNEIRRTMRCADLTDFILSVYPHPDQRHYSHTKSLRHGYKYGGIVHSEKSKFVMVTRSIILIFCKNEYFNFPAVSIYFFMSLALINLTSENVQTNILESVDLKINLLLVLIIKVF